MENFKEYDLVSIRGNNDGEFTAEVNKRIKEGWIPLGGVCTSFVRMPLLTIPPSENVFTLFTQAIVKV